MHSPLDQATSSARCFVVQRLSGKNVLPGAMPVAVLAELATLERLIQNLAKARHRAQAGSRRVSTKELPRLTLVVSGSVQSGSALLEVQTHGGLTATAVVAYEEARDEVLSLAVRANSGAVSPESFDPEFRDLWGSVGKYLEDGQILRFEAVHRSGGPVAAEVTRASREAWRRQLKRTAADPIALEGVIVQYATEANRFVLRDEDGEHECDAKGLDPEEIAEIATYFFSVGVRIEGTGIFKASAANNPKLRRVESIAALYPFPLITSPESAPNRGARATELESLDHQWDGDEAPPPSRQALDGMREILAALERARMPAPHLYPTGGSGVSLEWKDSSRIVVLQICSNGARLMTLVKQNPPLTRSEAAHADAPTVNVVEKIAAFLLA